VAQPALGGRCRGPQDRSGLIRYTDPSSAGTVNDPLDAAAEVVHPGATIPLLFSREWRTPTPSYRSRAASPSGFEEAEARQQGQSSSTIASLQGSPPRGSRPGHHDVHGDAFFLAIWSTGFQSPRVSITLAVLVKFEREVSLIWGMS
jgi:hypothetical protein